MRYNAEMLDLEQCMLSVLDLSVCKLHGLGGTVLLNFSIFVAWGLSLSHHNMMSKFPKSKSRCLLSKQQLPFPILYSNVPM